MVLTAEVGFPLAAVRDHVVASVDLVVHVARADGGRRRIVAVTEVDPDLTAGASSVRPLADADGLHALPCRPPRRSAAGPPRAEWLAR
jgi:hypothetical protein